MYFLFIRPKNKGEEIMPIQDLPKYIQSNVPKNSATDLNVIDSFTSSFESSDQFVEYINEHYTSIDTSKHPQDFQIYIKKDGKNYIGGAIFGKDGDLLTEAGLKKWFASHRSNPNIINRVVDSLNYKNNRRKIAEEKQNAVTAMDLLLKQLKNMSVLSENLDELKLNLLTYEELREIAIVIILKKVSHLGVEKENTLAQANKEDGNNKVISLENLPKNS